MPLGAGAVVVGASLGAGGTPPAEPVAPGVGVAVAEADGVEEVVLGDGWPDGLGLLAGVPVGVAVVVGVEPPGVEGPVEPPDRPMSVIVVPDLDGFETGCPMASSVTVSTPRARTKSTPATTATGRQRIRDQTETDAGAGGSDGAASVAATTEGFAVTGRGTFAGSSALRPDDRTTRSRLARAARLSDVE